MEISVDRIFSELASGDCKLVLIETEDAEDGFYESLVCQFEECDRIESMEQLESLSQSAKFIVVLGKDVPWVTPICENIKWTFGYKVIHKILSSPDESFSWNNKSIRDLALDAKRYMIIGIPNGVDKSIAEQNGILIDNVSESLLDSIYCVVLCDDWPNYISTSFRQNELKALIKLKIKAKLWVFARQLEEVDTSVIPGGSVGAQCCPLLSGMIFYLPTSLLNLTDLIVTLGGVVSKHIHRYAYVVVDVSSKEILTKDFKNSVVRQVRNEDAIAISVDWLKKAVNTGKFTTEEYTARPMMTPFYKMTPEEIDGSHFMVENCEIKNIDVTLLMELGCKQVDQRGDADTIIVPYATHEKVDRNCVTPSCLNDWLREKAPHFCTPLHKPIFVAEHLRKVFEGYEAVFVLDEKQSKFAIQWNDVALKMGASSYTHSQASVFSQDKSVMFWDEQTHIKDILLSYMGGTKIFKIDFLNTLLESTCKADIPKFEAHKLTLEYIRKLEKRLTSNQDTVLPYSEAQDSLMEVSNTEENSEDLNNCDSMPILTPQETTSNGSREVQNTLAPTKSKSTLDQDKHQQPHSPPTSLIDDRQQPLTDESLEDHDTSSDIEIMEGVSPVPINFKIPRVPGKKQSRRWAKRATNKLSRGSKQATKQSAPRNKLPISKGPIGAVKPKNNPIKSADKTPTPCKPLKDISKGIKRPNQQKGSSSLDLDNSSNSCQTTTTTCSDDSITLLDTNQISKAQSANDTNRKRTIAENPRRTNDNQTGFVIPAKISRMHGNESPRDVSMEDIKVDLSNKKITIKCNELTVCLELRKMWYKMCSSLGMQPTAERNMYTAKQGMKISINIASNGVFTCYGSKPRKNILLEGIKPFSLASELNDFVDLTKERMTQFFKECGYEPIFLTNADSSTFSIVVAESKTANVVVAKISSKGKQKVKIVAYDKIIGSMKCLKKPHSRFVFPLVGIVCSNGSQGNCPCSSLDKEKMGFPKVVDDREKLEGVPFVLLCSGDRSKSCWWIMSTAKKTLPMQIPFAQLKTLDLDIGRRDRGLELVPVNPFFICTDCLPIRKQALELVSEDAVVGDLEGVKCSIKNCQSKVRKFYLNRKEIL